MIIKLNNLVCYANETPLCKPVTLIAESGDLVILQGENGVGKSTIMRALAGIFSNISGKIELNGKVCYVGHEITLHDNLTIFDNIKNILMLEMAGKNDRIALDDKINSLLLTLKLHNKKRYYPWQLSQGQRRKLNLAKLLLTSHPVWLLDEPFVHLDLETQNILTGLLQNHLENNYGVAVVTSHSPICMFKQKVVNLEIN